MLVVDLGKYAELNAFWFRIGAIVSTSLGILEKSQLFHGLLLFCFILLFVFVLEHGLMEPRLASNSLFS